MINQLEPLTNPFIPPSLSHGFFTRQGGTSSKLFESLNVSLSKGDSSESVLKNREKIAHYFQHPLTSLCFPHQIHGNKAVFIDAPYDLKDSPKADALVTNVQGLIMGVQTADCVPVLLFDSKTPLVAALHGGWKGALSGIVENTIGLMLEKGAKRENLNATLGPSIAQSSYEVDETFHQIFRNQNKKWTSFFKLGRRDGHYFFDLQSFVTHKLREENISKIHNLAQDTYADAAGFFSCRRAFHKKETTFGNQASCIMIRPTPKKTP